MSSFRAALEQGADGLELDVMLSRDAEVVVIHDHSLDRTTNGSGRVGDMSLHELKRLDAGSSFDARFAGEPIPGLDEVLAAFGHESVLNVELKDTSPTDCTLEVKVVDLLEKHGLSNRVILSSFNPLALRRAKLLCPELHMGLLLQRRVRIHLQVECLAAAARADALHMHHTTVSDRSVRDAKRRGYRVNVWTVNEWAQMEQMIAVGVDGIITDRPGVLANLLSMP